MRVSVKVFAIVLVSAVAGALIGPALQLPPAGAQEAAANDERVFMLNVLWFKEDGGADKYNEYIQAATPFVVKHGGSGGQAYIPEQAMIGEFDADLFFVVEWPNMEAFLGLVQDPGYLKISHLREEAIADSLLIRCKPAS